MVTTTIEQIIEENRRTKSGATIRQVGDAALQLERLGDEVVLSWISQLTVKDFVAKFEATPDMVPGISVSRPSNDHLKVGAERLIDQTNLSDDEADRIFLIRYDQGSYSLAFEPMDIQRNGFNSVAVMAQNIGQALEVLDKYLPIEALSVASSPSFTDEN